MFVWSDYELNNEQEAAINEPNNVFLSACPGSGKTRTLTYKIALELSKIESNKKWVIAITYTNKAADEIRERIECLGVDISQLWVGTIHSFCLEWILKPYGIYHDKLKYGFKVINSFDTEEIISSICLSLRPEIVRFNQCSHFYTSSGLNLINNSGSPELVNRVISTYHQHLDLNNQIDFEQILYFAFEIMSRNSSIPKILANLFSNILVDEYQDTKEIQYSIITKIIKENPHDVGVFIVGDPNQAIYGSLGGYAITHTELEALSGVRFKLMSLDKNYRSSTRIIEYYSNYNVVPSNTVAEGICKYHKSIISYDQGTHKDDLVETISKHIETSIEVLGIRESEICVIAPWWTHLAALTRQLVNRLPCYNFDGPGLVPFSRDIENFWYKLSRIILTEPSPNMFVKRYRWASDLIDEMEFSSIDVECITPKILLKQINLISIDEENGLDYLRKFFLELFNCLDIDLFEYKVLKEHHDSFFKSTQDRINRLKNENEDFPVDIESFRRAFKARTGIKVSTIHGVKGGEYDVVISFGLLQGFVPNFSDNSSDSAKKLLYVIGSRARKNLYLISEKGRMEGFYPNQIERRPTEILNQLNFNYD